MSKPIKTKQCSKCKQPKPLSEFHRNKYCNDGHLNDCKSCCLKYQKEYRKTAKGRVANQKGIALYNIHHPEYRKAIHAVNNAIRASRLPRPDTLQCSYGNHKAQQYHHWHGYEPENWLDVVAVCIKCHMSLP